MKNLRIQYVIGKDCFSPEYSLENSFAFLNKQFGLSIPLITGIYIKYYKKRKKYLQKIYVGKEIRWRDFIKEEEQLEKYNLDLSDLADVAVLGYERACLLNFKKYEPIVVGVKNEDIIVPDYYSLKKVMYYIQNKVS